MKRKSMKRRSVKRRGGGATSFPLKFFKADAPAPNASAGSDLDGSYGNVVRNRLNTVGGVRRRRTQRKRGGFVPTVMEGFTQLAAKYITPLVLFAGYKLLNNRTKTRKARK